MVSEPYPFYALFLLKDYFNKINKEMNSFKKVKIRGKGTGFET